MSERRGDDAPRAPKDKVVATAPRDPPQQVNVHDASLSPREDTVQVVALHHEAHQELELSRAEPRDDADVLKNSPLVLSRRRAEFDCNQLLDRS